MLISLEDTYLLWKPERWFKICIQSFYISKCLKYQLQFSSRRKVI